jgi:hypothetical protein
MPDLSRRRIDAVDAASGAGVHAAVVIFGEGDDSVGDRTLRAGVLDDLRLSRGGIRDAA